MKIAIDLRSLQSGTISGVENYTLNLLEGLLATDKKNTYSLFYNAFKKSNLPEFNYINAKTVRTGIPNKILNLLFKLNLLSLEKIVGEFDVLFMPNLNTLRANQAAKIALTVHDLSFSALPEHYDLKRNLWHSFLNVQKLLSKINVVFAVSHYTKNELVKAYRLPETKIKVIYPGVDLEIFRPDIPVETLRRVRNLYNLPGEYFLFLNTLEPRKNLVAAIEAFERITSKTHLVIAGKKGWKISKIISRIKNSPKKDRIHYIGYLKEEDKPAMLKIAKALIYPSFYEGFGFQPLEAMGVGTPVIASQVSSLPEVVGTAAIMVNPYSKQDLVKAMEELDANKLLRNLLIHKGFKRVRQFSWKTSAQQTLYNLESLYANRN